MIHKYIQALKADSSSQDSESILTMLYEAYSDHHPMEDTEIKAAFESLYQAMNGMELLEMDRIIYPICTLCRTHQRSGFEHGVRIGVALAGELSHHKNES